MDTVRGKACWLLLPIAVFVLACNTEGKYTSSRRGRTAQQRVDPRERMDRANAIVDGADILISDGKYEAAIAELKKAIEIDPKCITAHYLLGWIRATAPDPLVRNGEVAVKEAQAAIDADQYYDQFRVEDKRARWMLYACLAAAHAELRQFDEAVKAQEKALQFVEFVPAEDRGVKMRELVDSRCRAALQLYKARRPLRTRKSALSHVSDDWVKAVLEATDTSELPEVAE